MSEVLQKLHDGATGVDAIRWSALAVTSGYVGLVTLFVGGYAVTDPGGWVGIGGTAAAVAIMCAMALLALVHPGRTLAVLVVAACAPLAFGLWSLTDYAAAYEWEDSHGPVSLVLVVAICGPAAVAGLHHPRAAAHLIIAVSVIPVLLASVGAGAHFYEPLSVGFLLMPLLVAAGLFLLAGHLDRSPQAPGTPTPR